MTSSLKEIYIGPERMGPMESVSSVAAITGRGLKGDRYEAGTGSYSNSAGFRDVTLIEMEALWGLFTLHDKNQQANSLIINEITRKKLAACLLYTSPSPRDRG